MLQQIKPNVIHTHHKRAANDDFAAVFSELTNEEQEILAIATDNWVKVFIKNREHIA